MIRRAGPVAERRYPVSGEIDMASAPDLQANLLALVNATNQDLVLDCQDLEFIDSTGIAVLVYTRRLLEVDGRQLRVENLHGMPRRALDLIGLTEMLEAAESESV